MGGSGVEREGGPQGWGSEVDRIAWGAWSRGESRPGGGEPRPPALPPRVSPGGGEGTSQPPSFFTVVGKALLFCFRFDLFAF